MTNNVENKYISIEITGLDTIPKDAVRIVERVVSLTAQSLQPQMVKEEPIDQGYLRESTQLPRVISPFEQSIDIEANYWRPVHFGVQGTKRKPNPFIDRAVDTIEPRIAEFVKMALDEAAR